MGRLVVAEYANGDVRNSFTIVYHDANLRWQQVEIANLGNRRLTITVRHETVPARNLSVPVSPRTTLTVPVPPGLAFVLIRTEPGGQPDGALTLDLPVTFGCTWEP